MKTGKSYDRESFLMPDVFELPLEEVKVAIERWGADSKS
jgi:hypothetical protein